MIGLVLAGALAGSAWWLLSRDQPEGGPDVALPRDVDLYYFDISAGAVVRMDVASGRTETLAQDLPRIRGATLSPDGRWFAYEPLGEREGNLFILDLETGQDRRIGPGHPPAWSADSRRIAFRVPLAGEDPTDPSAPTALAAASGPGFVPEILVEEGFYTPVAWIREAVAIVDVPGGEAALLEPGGEPEPFATGIGGLWGVAPDGDWAIVITPERATELVALPGRERTPLVLLGEIANGAWRPDGEVAIAPVSVADGAGGVTAALFAIDPERATARPVPRTESVYGDVLWGPQGEHFAYSDASPGWQRVCVWGGGCVDAIRTDSVVPLGLV